MTDRERKILTLTCFGHYMSHFNVLVFPALVLPLTVRWGLDVAPVLALSFWMYLLFGVTALPWGMAADRLGAKPFMLLYFLGSGMSALAAAWWLDSPGLFSLALGGIGLFSGIYHPIGLGMISKGISRISLAMGYNGIFGNLGLASAPLLAGLINWLLGPKAAFAVLGGFNLLGLALMARMDIPDQRTATHSSNPGSDNPGRTTSWTPFLILLVAMMIGGLAYRAATVITPAYFELKSGAIVAFLSEIWPGSTSANLVATSLVSVIYAVGALGQYLGGRVSDRHDPRFVYLTFHALTIPSVFSLAWLTDLPLFGVAMFYFFLLLGMQPSENTLVSRLTPPGLQHSAYGAKFMLTFGVGAAAVHLVGLVQAAWSMEAIFLLLSAVAGTMVLIILLLIRATRGRRLFQPPQGG